jgi:hypothetical protein
LAISAWMPWTVGPSLAPGSWMRGSGTLYSVWLQLAMFHS